MKKIKARKSTGRSALPQRLSKLAQTDAGALLELMDRLPDERLRTLLLLRHGFGLSWPAIRIAGGGAARPVLQRAAPVPPVCAGAGAGRRTDGGGA